MKVLSILVGISILDACGGGGGGDSSGSSETADEYLDDLFCVLFPPVCLLKSRPVLEPDQVLMTALPVMQPALVEGKAPAAYTPTAPAEIVVLAVAADTSGGTFVTGYIMDDRYGEGNTRRDRDAVLAKYGSDGSLDWAHRFGSVNDEYGQHLVLSDEGRVEVTVMRNAVPAAAAGAGKNDEISISVNRDGVVVGHWNKVSLSQ